MFKVYYNSLCISCMCPSVFSLFFFNIHDFKNGMMSNVHFVARLGIVVSTLQSFV